MINAENQKLLKNYVSEKWSPFTVEEIKKYQERNKINQQKADKREAEKWERNRIENEKRQAEYEKQEKERKEREKERWEKWNRGENVGPVYFGREYPLKLRVFESNVETSLGAVIPVKMALKFWTGIKSGDTGQGFNFGSYTADGIKDGVLTVGCHEIPVSELERVANVLGA